MADQEKLEKLLEGVITDVAAAFSAPLVAIGNRLGLYRQLAEAGPMTPGELASAVGVAEPIVREWLANQAVGGYVVHDPATGRFTMTEEQVAVFADPASPTSLTAAFDLVCAFAREEPRLSEAFSAGGGFGWHEHIEDVFSGVERFFRPAYESELVESWIPALDGIQDRLEAGIRVADVGCGHGVSTRLMARNYPASTVIGFDFHKESIERARRQAAEEGLSDRVEFQEATSTTFGGTYDLITVFDAFHDMGNPRGVAEHLRSALAPDGTCMLVEPLAGNDLQDNMTPVGRAYYAGSALACVPCALEQGEQNPLGAQAGAKRLSEVLGEGGLSDVRVAAETPFNLVLEARP